jgi:outer membrane immunogenic protein
VRNFLKLLLGAACCTGATGAMAADMSLPPAPPPVQAPPPPLWTGFYVGVNGGGAWDPTGGQNTNCGSACTAAETTLAGVAGGVQVGYNYQLGVMVIGVEGEFSGSSLRGSYPALDTIDTLTTSVDYFGTVTGKLGVAVNRLLIYGKGGVAWVHTNNSDYDTLENATFTSNYWQMGWTVGGGAEYGLSPNWSVKLEYSLIETPNKSTTFNGPSGLFFTALLHQQISQVTAGVNYRF